jgi:hypothetical protein
MTRNTLPSYVKFMKGSYSAYNALTTKDPNVLYFISDDNLTGTLYVGATKIGLGNIDELRLLVDNATVSQADDGTLSLANYQKSYWKYIPKTDSEDSKYVEVEVSDDNPWKENLEPRVVKKDGKFILGWFEQNPTTIEGLTADIAGTQAALTTAQTDIISLQTAVSTTIPAQIDTKIAEAIATKDLLSYTITEFDEDGNLIVKDENPEQYIYLVKNEDEHYDEYMYINGAIEKVGDWKVNLDDYATKAELQSAVSSLTPEINGHESRITDLESTVSSITSSVSSHDSRLSGLDASLAALTSTVSSHSSSINSLDDQIKSFSTEVNSLPL